ncbi:CAMK/CAMKL/AMPK protein kinase [Pyricularia oryzae]|nr:CAMK/CAMKL/AMPK protein kinase [Pyricularia oryzae]KAI7924545.1 CAMK/CAMKL/AMPK protein kinase [Pyricularia oryzae]
MAHCQDRGSNSRRGSLAHGTFEDEELSLSLTAIDPRNTAATTTRTTPTQHRRDDSNGRPRPKHSHSHSRRHSQHAQHQNQRQNQDQNQQSPPSAMPPTVHRGGGGGGPNAMPADGSTSSKIRVDQRISAYEISKTLGEGSFGKVKLAVHKGTKQMVALKIISRKRLASTDMAGRVEREIEYLQLLRHPHIIKLYTVIKTDNEIIMVLEYAGGELFDHIVTNGRLSEDEARRFFQQMLCAVEYCHRHKIVHRDLKPENLLLDDNLNVKIADFGLSNIMTDGNFLKTSCGSPNYAAPEVISGKLYAGSEVDVWSCGVILYVLLVGRLPFDDDHIPTLFSKIARGTYVVPHWMSPGAAALIKKMLVVNPVNRATITEIRQDPWFTTELPEYLQPPIEPFFNTGIDPEKAIRPSDIAPNAPPKVQEKLHAEVTDKISKTMGYGKQDVLDALEAEEPSAIKDAYMIVRENKMMQSNPALGGDNPFFATTPLGDENGSTGIMETMDSAMSASGHDPNASPMTSMSVRSATSSTLSAALAYQRPYTSKIGILPSSLPAYHNAYMESEKSGTAQDVPDMMALNEPPAPARTPAEQEETARRLRPHARSSQSAADSKPQSLTPSNAPKKTKPTRWQFGIRSRNAPFEALLCIYKALKKLDCSWKIDRDYHKVHGDENEKHRSRGDAGTPYILPADPWHIEARWETGPLRTHSVMTDPKNSAAFPGGKVRVQKKHSNNSSEDDDEEANATYEVIAMRLSIQIYEMESGVYLVDFKCAGYELPDGRLMEEKDVTSPFPFLDLAARLIIQLADAD